MRIGAVHGNDNIKSDPTEVGHIVNAAFITARKRSLRQGNVLTGVCLSTLGACVAAGACVRERGHASQGRHVWQGERVQKRWPLKWSVPILLECILVSYKGLGGTGVVRKIELKSIHSGNVVNRRSMNWCQFKDPVSDLCLIGCLAMS